MPIQRGSETISESSALHTRVSAQLHISRGTVTAWPDDRSLWEACAKIHIRIDMYMYIYRQVSHFVMSPMKAAADQIDGYHKVQPS